MSSFESETTNTQQCNDAEAENASENTTEVGQELSVPMEQDNLFENIAENNPFLEASAPPAEPQVRRDSTKSEFEDSDKQEFFELWSSDLTSPDSDSSCDQPSNKKTSQGWNEDIKKENVSTFDFTGNSGIINLDLERKYTALECFKLFVDDELINLMVRETNRHAKEKFDRPGYHRGFLSGWIDVNHKEMSEFLGLIIFMTIKRFPDTSCYWSTNRLYSNSVVCRIMTQTRFHRILHFWHYGNDGTECPYSKVNPIVNRLNNNFIKYKQPGNILYIGKNTVYLRDKYMFERAPLGDCKWGSKILKLIDQDVYTYKVHILSPDTCAKKITQTKNAVLSLVDNFLDQGRLFIFHNLYISLELAQEIIKRKSHCIGLIRKKARGTPTELQSKKVKNGSLIGYQNSQGISVMKWNILDAPYYGITTCHTLDTVTVQKKIKNRIENTTSMVEEQVPQFLKDISLSEKVFDAHDKYSGISTSPTTEEVKWYKRLACDLVTNTAITNALVLYKKLNKEKIKMWDFRDKLFRELVNIKQLPSVSSDDETEDPDFLDD